MTRASGLLGTPTLWRAVLVTGLCLLQQGCLVTLFHWYAGMRNIEANTMMLSPATLGANVELRGISLFTDADGEQTRLEGLMAVKDDLMHFDILAPLGGRFAAVRQRGSRIEWFPPPKTEREKKRARKASVQPWHPVFLIQLVLWPERAVRQMLESTKWQIHTGATTRQIYYNDTLLLDIELVSNERPWSGTVVIRQPGFNIQAVWDIVPLVAPDG